MKKVPKQRVFYDESADMFLVALKDEDCIFTWLDNYFNVLQEIHCSDNFYDELLLDFLSAGDYKEVEL